MKHTLNPRCIFIPCLQVPFWHVQRLSHSGIGHFFRSAWHCITAMRKPQARFEHPQSASYTRSHYAIDTKFYMLIHTIYLKGEHECTRGWPGSVPVGLHTFKIETQICVSNKVQVTWIRRSSTRENTSTCHLIKKCDTNRIWASSLLHLRPVMP